MATLSKEEICEPLNEYFMRSSYEYRIGLQNFQSIREYTNIPISPITVSVGDNSSGKSIINNALSFFHNYLGGKCDATEFLDKWASKNRTTRPLIKGFIGNPDDVVISICAQDYYGSFFNGIPRLSHGYLPSSFLWQVGTQPKVPMNFELRFHFSYIEDEEGKCSWIIREFYLIFGSDILFKYIEDIYCAKFHINQCHLLYQALNCCYENNLNEMILASSGHIGRVKSNGSWLILEGCFLSIKWMLNCTPFCWMYNEARDFSTNLLSSPIKDVQNLLEEMVMVPSLIASKFSNLVTVPPVRSIPTKNEACFRIDSSETNRDSKSHDWKRLAIASKDQSILKLSKNTIRNHMGDPVDALNYVNNILQNSLFLNVDYKVDGECHFLLSAKQINKIKKDPAEFFHIYGENVDSINSEVHLRLKNVPGDFLVEIEDSGAGLSQFIPLLCTIYDASAYVHHPELHLPPKQQSHLGDIFIERINNGYDTPWDSRCVVKPGRFFVIETNSEQLLLRVLRRIRETNRNETENELFSFTTEQLCVLYFDKNKYGDTKVIKLRVSKDGELIGPLPKDMFTRADGD